MKRYAPIYLLIALLSITTIACDEHYITYDDKEYVMFSEQEQYFLVEENQEYFSIDIASTLRSNHDRTFGVEVIDEGSNAIEGVHYRLLSNSVTIPAGHLVGKVKVKGIYENISATDSLGFRLKLVVPEEMAWDDLYKDGTETKVVMYKSCPFDIHNFEGWCLVSSMLLQYYPGDNMFYQRVVKAEVHPTEEDTIILHDCFYDGYDINLKFHGKDPEKPLISMDKDQVISDEASVFGQILGDNHILATNSPNYDSYFNSCQRYGVLWLHVYVDDLGERVGTVGHYYNVLEWITDEEAEEYKKEL